MHAPTPTRRGAEQPEQGERAAGAARSSIVLLVPYPASGLCI
jgi:hypothetical protein